MVGRDVLLRVDKPPPSPGAPLLEVDDLTVATTAARDGARRVASTCAPARSSASPASTATARRSSIEALRACARRRPDRDRRGRDVTARGARDARAGRRAHPRGSPAPRARPRLLARREPRASRLPQRAESRVRLAVPERLVARAQRLLEDSTSAAATRRRSSGALRWQPAEGRVAREISREPERADRRAADARARRRCDRVPAQAARRERDAGRGMLLVSLELEEILSLADRILVIYEGGSSASSGRRHARRDSGSR